MNLGITLFLHCILVQIQDADSTHHFCVTKTMQNSSKMFSLSPRLQSHSLITFVRKTKRWKKHFFHLIAFVLQPYQLHSWHFFTCSNHASQIKFWWPRKLRHWVAGIAPGGSKKLRGCNEKLRKRAQRRWQTAWNSEVAAKTWAEGCIAETKWGVAATIWAKESRCAETQRWATSGRKGNMRGLKPDVEAWKA